MNGEFKRQYASAHGGPSDYEITPQQVPTVATDLCTEDIHITEVVLTNNTAGVITMNMRDKQTTPAPLLPDAVSVAAHTVVSFEFPRGALMIGGVVWYCTAGGQGGSGLWGRVRGF